MPCNVSQLNLNFPIPPSPGGIVSPFQIPLPKFDLPKDLIEDILALLKQLQALWPGMTFSPNPDSTMKSILDMVMNLLSQLAPFLALYNLLIAALKLIICIIQVLCAIPNPFAVAAALATLFSECLPAFLNIFPWIALIIMIITLLLLILALIEYLIATIIAIIEDMIKNIVLLAVVFATGNVEAIIAVTSKIASLLCIIQNLLAVLAAIAAIIAVIQALALIGGASICDDSSPAGCCPPSICPAFIKNTPNGIDVTTGTLIYYPAINVDSTTLFSSIGPNLGNIIALPPVRNERWQLIDNEYTTALFPINLIITPVFDPAQYYTDDTSGNIFWPEPLEFASTVSASSAPYTADLTVSLDPRTYGISDDKGFRPFFIKGCIVVREPYIGVMDQDNNINPTNQGGTLNVEGGLVFEADKTTAYRINGKGSQLTLNNFIHKTPMLVATSDALPATDDSTQINLSFNWKPNAPALAGYTLVTVGCIPAVSIEKAVQNAIMNSEGVEPAIVKLNGKVAPDINGAQTCTTNALNKFRGNVNVAAAGVLSAELQGCLNALKNETTSIVCTAITAAVSAFKSTITLDTDVQFTTRPIIASVVLKDPTGTTLSSNIPDACVSPVVDVLKGHVTLGSITDFTYDKVNANFHATITSKESGDGELTVSFNGKDFSTVVPAVGTKQSSIIENIVLYTFVDGVAEPIVRRNEGDVGEVNA